MPSTGLTVGTIFNNLPAGNVLASLLDNDLGQLFTAYNSLLSTGNYYVDTSVTANQIVVSVPSPLVVSYAAGLPLQIQVANTNTGAVTLNVNGLGSQNVVYANGGNQIVANQFSAGMIVSLMFDGTNFQYLGSALASAAPGTIYFARKASTTARTNNTSTTNDPDLVLSGVASGSYALNMLLAFNGTGSGAQGIQVVTSLSPGPNTGLVFWTGWINGAVTQSSGAGSGVGFSRATIDTGTFDCISVSGTLVVAATSTFAVQWAQLSSSANATNMLAGSSMTLQKVA